MIAALFADTNIKLTIILMVIACLLPFVCAALAKYLGGYNIKTIKHLVSFGKYSRSRHKTQSRSDQ